MPPTLTVGVYAASRFWFLEAVTTSGDVLYDIVEQHAAEAVFGWSSRDDAVNSPAYDLLELCEIDERLACHLEGLALAGDAGVELCQVELEDEEPGAIFAASVLALESRDFARFAVLLDLAAVNDVLRRGVVSALSWLPFEPLRRALAAMVVPGAPPKLQLIGIAAHANHRRDPGAVLQQAIESRDSELRARACRAAGELGRTDLIANLRGSFEHAHEGCRFWSRWSATLLGDGRGASALTSFAEEGGELAPQAADLVVRRLRPDDARTWIEGLASDAATLRVALRATGAFGDPAMAPWLLTVADPEAARAAAWAFTLITNANVTDELEGDSPELVEPDDDDELNLHPDEALPWPDPAKLLAWWNENRQVFVCGTRHLLGRPRKREWLEHILRAGNQAARASAACDMRLSEWSPVLFEVRAPGFRQLQQLKMVSS